MSLHYFELPKLPRSISAKNGKELWLALFDADTEEEIKKLEVLEVPTMKQAIEAYRSITASPEFRGMERLRSKARHEEAQALRKARLDEREKWRSAIDAVTADRDAVIADRDAAIANKDAMIAKLRAQIDKTEK